MQISFPVDRMSNEDEMFNRMSKPLVLHPVKISSAAGETAKSLEYQPVSADIRPHDDSQHSKEMSGGSIEPRKVRAKNLHIMKATPKKKRQLPSTGGEKTHAVNTAY